MAQTWQQQYQDSGLWINGNSGVHPVQGELAVKTASLNKICQIKPWFDQVDIGWKFAVSELSVDALNEMSSATTSL